MLCGARVWKAKSDDSSGGRTRIPPGSEGADGRQRSGRRHVLIPHWSPSHTSTGTELTHLSVTRTNAGYPFLSIDRRRADGNGDATAIFSRRSFLNLKLLVRIHQHTTTTS